MTKAKNEAIELVEKFDSISGLKRYSKAYAIICIEHTINEFKVMVPSPYKGHYRHLEEVKSEIEKL